MAAERGPYRHSSVERHVRIRAGERDHGGQGGAGQMDTVPLQAEICIRGPKIRAGRPHRLLSGPAALSRIRSHTARIVAERTPAA